MLSVWLFCCCCGRCGAPFMAACTKARAFMDMSHLALIPHDSSVITINTASGWGNNRGWSLIDVQTLVALLLFHSFLLPCPHSGLFTFHISASQVRMHSCPHGKCSQSLHKARPIKINWGSLLSHQVQLLCSHVFIYSLPAERWKKEFYAGPPPANATLRRSYVCYVEDRETNRSEMRNIRQPRFARTDLTLCFALTKREAGFSRAISKSGFALINRKPRFIRPIGNLDLQEPMGNLFCTEE